MRARQASIPAVFCVLILVIAGCTTSTAMTPTAISETAAPTMTAAPTVIVPSPTATAPQCLSLPGTLGRDSLKTTQGAQEFIFYLPPCYFQFQTTAYPVLYLLHGQTYTDDQWVRIGAADAADRLIISGEAPPFIIVFPDDRSWNLVAGPGFGDRLLALIPYIDANFRTLADRDHRSIGGLSRGGGWSARLGFTHTELFGTLGLHSPAMFKEDGPYMRTWVQAVAPEMRPRLWLDIGDRDAELREADSFSDFLAEIGYPHEFHRYAGDHTEGYWGLHVEEYLRWYAQAWSTSTTEP
jgi:enterochelin esterase-like enzyme